MKKKTLNMENVLGLVLAGGQGERLYPLTKDRAKPAVPIAGTLRIVDFVLNNMIKSDIRKIYLLTQAKQDSLNRHILDFWNIYNVLGDNFVATVPAQMRIGKEWYQGTADAVQQNIHLIKSEKPEIVTIFGGDHVYYMNIKEAVQFHKDNNADVTICANPIQKKDCPREKDGRLSFGIIDSDLESVVKGFKEKPMPEDVTEEKLFVSMGNYIFNKDILLDALSGDAEDFGKHVLPQLVKEGKKVMTYDFSKNNVPGLEEEYEKGYWEDVGTIDSYHRVSMDLRDVTPKLNLYNDEWAIWRNKHYKNSPPNKPVFAEGIDEAWFDELERGNRRVSGLFKSLAATGIIVSGNALESVIGANVRIHSYARVINSVIFDDVNIGRHAKIKNAIIDKDVEIPEYTRIGYDKEEDKARGFTISPGGITVVEKGYKFK